MQGLSFGPGLLPQPPLVFSFSGLALPDSEPEFTEGLLLYLEIDESSLEPRDLERLQSGDIRIENGLILVSITGNDREELLMIVSDINCVNIHCVSFV